MTVFFIDTLRARECEQSLFITCGLCTKVLGNFSTSHRCGAAVFEGEYEELQCIYPIACVYISTVHMSVYSNVMCASV